MLHFKNSKIQKLKKNKNNNQLEPCSMLYNRYLDASAANYMIIVLFVVPIFEVRAFGRCFVVALSMNICKKE